MSDHSEATPERNGQNSEPPVEVILSSTRLNQMANSITNMEGLSEAPESENVAAVAEQEQSHLNIMADRISTIKASSGYGGTGEEVFTCKNVQVYFIKPDQKVATRSNSDNLRIITIPQEQQNLVSDNPTPPAFLEAGGWMYPLIPSQSPVYRSPEGFYIFPDLLASSPGASVGLVLPDTMAPSDRETFEMMLLNLSGRDSFPNPPSDPFGNPIDFISNAQGKGPSSSVTPSKSNKAPDRSGQSNTGRTRSRSNRRKVDNETPLERKSSNLCNKIAVGMMAVAEGMSIGLSFGAMKTAELIDTGTGLVKDQLSPVSEPTQIEPEIRDVVSFVCDYSGKAVELSSKLVSKLAETTAALASYAAYHCQAKATELAVTYGGQSESATKDCIDGMLILSEGAVNAVSMVYTGLHNAARTLATSLTYNTIDVVGHCHGADAGEIVEIAADTVGNITTVGLKVNSIKPKKIIARTVATTGRQLIIKTSEPPELQIPNFNMDTITNILH